MTGRRLLFSSTFGIALALAAALGGCGRKGPPQPPPGVPNTYPQPYPRA
jgi:predicted small lipoprotein YifL